MNHTFCPSFPEFESSPRCFKHRLFSSSLSYCHLHPPCLLSLLMLISFAFYSSDSFISLFFLFSSPSSHLSPSLLEKGPMGDADLWLEPHFPAFCGRRVWSHGIAISPARRYGFRQLQAAAGSLIRSSVMSPHLTCRRCNAALKGGRLITDWGYAGEAAIPIQHKGPVLYAVIDIGSISATMFCVLTKFS